MKMKKLKTVGIYNLRFRRRLWRHLEPVFQKKIQKIHVIPSLLLLSQNHWLLGIKNSGIKYSNIWKSEVLLSNFDPFRGYCDSFLGSYVCMRNGLQSSVWHTSNGLWPVAGYCHCVLHPCLLSQRREDRDLIFPNETVHSWHSRDHKK